MNDVLDQRRVILGVDTHMDVHVGAIINPTGKLLGTKSVSVNSYGYQDLYDWASTFGLVIKARMEGIETYGSGLCKLLGENGVQVFEVNRISRTSGRLLLSGMRISPSK
jgi:hypothetical protein